MSLCDLSGKQPGIYQIWITGIGRFKGTFSPFCKALIKEVCMRCGIAPVALTDDNTGERY